MGENINYCSTIGLAMSFLCCGVIYDKKNINNYWCIDTYLTKNKIADRVKNRKVKKEVIETVTCLKCGCTKMAILRYGMNKGKQVLLQDVRLKPKATAKFLAENMSNLIRQEQKVPTKAIKYGKNIPFVYGAVTGAETQRAKYLDNSGYCGDEIIAKVVSYD